MRAKGVVEAAYDMVQYHYNAAAQGAVTEQEARDRAREVVRSLHCDGDEYFWINDMNGVIVARPCFGLEGKDTPNAKDADEKSIVAGFVNKVKAEKAGYVRYAWKRTDSEALTSKIAYVKGFEPWGWVIGSDIYTRDIDAVFRNRAIEAGLVTLFMLCVVVGLSVVLGKGITQPLALVSTRLERLAEGDLTAIEGEEDGVISERVSRKRGRSSGPFTP